ncbi:hypothetical protein BHYA_0072g00180 [Botrytis hyacinthi]|uniref:Uncharacterized protein n=1 Tax=Botrytis hyacinthi TaxID=278943 RepID=A0A4Z1GP97_9HELO|nr:hypothetical protein BHYA_0072g00180 [Botrytis hyacinthi]
MRNQSILSFALVAFASTSLATSSVVERGMPIEDLHAAIVSAGAEFDQLTARGQAEFASLAAYAVERDVEARANDAASLLALLPAGHGSSKREPEEESKRADSAAGLLALLPAGHGSGKRADSAAGLLALLPAGHGSGKRADSAAGLLALLPAGHEKREPSEEEVKRAESAAGLLALLPAGHGSG